MTFPILFGILALIIIIIRRSRKNHW